jgi:cyclic pyranopterin phosphate synthase
VFAQAGVRRVRLTGGEPLLRPHLELLVAMLADIEDIDEVALTTNGTMLAARAQALAAAGLSRVTVSLDALRADVLAAMSGRGFPLARVLAGITAAADAGLGPVKVNMVVRRGVNDHCVLEMAEFFRGRSEILRFIEFMDVGATNGWQPADVVTAAEIREQLDRRWGLEPLAPSRAGEVATRWRYADGAGEIGFIHSVSEPFCGQCSRARLSADGALYTCLFATSGTDLRGPLRAGATDAELVQLIGRVWSNRTDRYSAERATEARSTMPSTAAPKVEMSYIGG